MRDLPNTTGSVSISEAPGEAGSFTAPSPGKAFYQDLIQRANTVPITRIFKYYGLRLDENNKKIVCPIPSHKGGRENSASFQYYPQTNTFWCFGCKTGVGCCELMAAMEGSSKTQAAFKILELFGTEADEDAILDSEDFSERLEIMMDFSNIVRDFRHTYIDEKSSIFIEDMCSIYDSLNLRHKNLNNEALRSIVEKLKKKIIFYKSCHTL